MKTKDVFCYDSGDDSLTFVRKGNGADHTLNLGLLLLSLNEKNEVVALELMGAHKNFKIDKNVLKNLSKAKLKFDFHKDKKTLIINIELLCKDRETIRPLIVLNDFSVEGLMNESQSFKACA